MKLDVFNHVFPRSFIDTLEATMPKAAVARWMSIETLHDMDARLRMLDAFGDYQQIISMSQPPIDVLGGPDETPNLARIANDGMAEICRQHPARFPSFLMSPPMNNPDAAVKEIDRAITELGACGAQIHSNVNGRALDDPAFYPVFERLERLGKPVFLHPARPMSHADYEAEDESKYEIFWGLGWAYETSAAMARIVFSGLFDKLPNLKILAHHWGAYIPHAEGRIPYWEGRSSQSDQTNYGPLKDNLKRPAMEYFKMFHVDTAMFGAQAASQAGLDFFGSNMSLFASDCPFDPEGGRLLIRDTIKVLDALDCNAAAREDIYVNNARKFLDLG
jgi:aminocarboxymuconate-semialdehyde decarboxylase